MTATVDVQTALNKYVADCEKAGQLATKDERYAFCHGYEIRALEERDGLLKDAHIVELSLMTTLVEREAEVVLSADIQSYEEPI